MIIESCNLIINFNIKYESNFKNLIKYKSILKPEFLIKTCDDIINFNHDNLIKDTEYYKLYKDNNIIYQENYLNNELIGILKYDKKNVYIKLIKDSFYYEYVLSQYAYVYLIENYTNFIFIHSSSISYHNKGILLLAESGVGKSTLRKLFTNGVDGLCINDDKNIIGLINDDIYIFNSIFAGKDFISESKVEKLRYLIFLEQGNKNELIKLDIITTFKLLLKQVKLPIYKNKEHWNKVIDKILTLDSFKFINKLDDNNAKYLIKELKL